MEKKIGGKTRFENLLKTIIPFALVGYEVIITNSRYAPIGYFITSYPTRAHGIIVVYSRCLLGREMTANQQFIWQEITPFQTVDKSLCVKRYFQFSAIVSSHARKATMLNELHLKSHLCYKTVINYDLDIADILVLFPQILLLRFSI